MKKIWQWSAREERLLHFGAITENMGNVWGDTVDRYIKTPVQSGHPERLIVGLPLGLLNGTGRMVDAVLAGAAGQRIDVPDGTMAEIKRDGGLVKEHALPPKPLKLATDLLRVPGSLWNGFTDSATGFDTRGRIARTLAS